MNTLAAGGPIGLLGSTAMAVRLSLPQSVMAKARAYTSPENLHQEVTSKYAPDVM
jgi:hypothetical protein